MKPLRHKLTFQLTPLLDLLLIVIFAQYMEMQQQTESETLRAESRRKAARQELEQLRQSLADLKDRSGSNQNRLAEAESRLDSLKAEHDQLEDEAEGLKQRNVALQESLEQAREQRDLVGEMVAELFRVPEDLIEKLLTPSAPSARVPDGEQIAALKEQFRDLTHRQPEEMVKHLLTYEELRKRTDIWDIYIAENGTMTLAAGERTFRFRAATAESFATQVYDFYKSLPEPKSLVIILLSYGDTQAVWRKAAADGLREAASRMQADQSGETSFEYANLGYRPRKTPPENQNQE